MSTNNISKRRMLSFLDIDWYIKITSNGHYMLLSKDRKWPPIVISLHRKKGNQVSDIDLRKIAEYYGITKPKLVRIITGNSWNIELSKLTKGEYDNKMSNAQNDVPSEQSVDTVHIQR